MGRQPDGSPNWFFFGEPTAANSNITAATLNIEYTDAPEISLASGFYTGSQNVVITTSSPFADIRYTLDGAKPSSSSFLYDSPVTVDVTTVLRARVFEVDKLPGPILTRTYFIDEDIDIIISDYDMPILNGLDMIDKIRKINKDIPIVLVTAIQEIDVTVKALQLNVNNFLKKQILHPKKLIY